MNIMAICSALNYSYIAIYYEGKIFSKTIKGDENYHSLYIVSDIKKMLENNQISLNQINAITVNSGPGSFSGIRVAMTIAKVLSGELNIPLIPLNTAQILLYKFNCDYFVMDARRDMYYLGDKNEIVLIPKDKIKEIIKDKKIITDKRSFEISDNAICYEDMDLELGEIMVDLAKKKYNNTTDKDEFNPLKVEANYIQTPPVF